jgi:hypothetical protein
MPTQAQLDRLAAAVEEIKRLGGLLDDQEASIQQAFARFVGDATSPQVMEEVLARLEAGDVEGALSIMDSFIRRLGSAITQAFQTAGYAEAAALAPAVAELFPALGVSFDPFYPRAAQLMATSLLSFIQEFSDAQREATRAALVASYQSGEGIRATAAAFRDSIGLTKSQLEAVANYRTALESGTREALDRQLRDRRFDPTVSRAAREGEPLSNAQVERMVEAYRRRFLAYRAETIARTQSTRVTSQARREAFTQTLEQAGLGTDWAERTWRGIRDTRERNTHLAMEGQTRSFDAPFNSPSGARLLYPGDPSAPAAEVVNCRCVEVYRIKSRAEVAA